MFPEAVTIFDHNFNRKFIRSWVLLLRVAFILSATLCCFWVNIEAILAILVRTLLGNFWATNFIIVDEFDIQGRSDAFCLWEANAQMSEEASKAD